PRRSRSAWATSMRARSSASRTGWRRTATVSTSLRSCANPTCASLMKVASTALPDVKLIEPSVFTDDRGFFFESWNARALAEAGIDATFVQDNHSRSRRHVLRGLHYQIEHAQGKLVRCVSGEVYDVAVDLRRSSPTFGRAVGVPLSADNRRMLWIP